MTVAVLTFIAFLTVFHCNADNLPPPEEFHYEWTNPITLKLIWKEPRNPPDSCEILYEVKSLLDNSTKRTPETYLVYTCPRENLNIDHWTYTITAVGTKNCSAWKSITPVTVNVSSQMPQVDLVKDFRCAIDQDGINCSWIPVQVLQNLSYCSCSSSVCEPVCNQPYSIENRTGCDIDTDSPLSGCYFEVRSASEVTIVKPHIELHIPELNVTEEGHKLKLTWTAKDVGRDCRFFVLCYTECDRNEEGLNITGVTYEMFYNQRCQYTFRTRVLTNSFCPPYASKWSTAVTYGINKLPDRTLTVVTIIIPIILFVSVILSCYCFKKHSEILCPNTPDPSAIFKELMELNGNKEYKSEAKRLYRPMPEVIEKCKISIIADNSDNKVY
ncbi:uncharacterized protein LOC103391290 [Cynoglossus semilaevis]|uniref:Uncharacterized LOC103391290 n=1 Tax=Cynoglossus semilaevis TaxID=244447 RepID=A0A3P8W247_CYNSE|nr:uncharacterized protein LOC103391290 [Cynoglossus semilaevis]